MEQVATHAFHRLGDAVLVDGVSDPHDALGHTLAEDVTVQLAGALADQSDADAELAPFAEDLLEHVGADRVGAGGRKVVRLLDHAKDRVGDVGLVFRADFLFFGVDARLVDAAQERGRDHLLFALVHLVQLHDGALARLEQFGQFQVLEVVEDLVAAQRTVDAPDQPAGRAVLLGLDHRLLVVAAATPLRRLAHGKQQLLQSKLALELALGEAVGAAQLIVHLVAEVGEQIAQVADGQAVDADLDGVRAEDADLGAIVAVLEGRVILHVLERVILAVRVEDDDRGLVVRHHQFFQQHPGEIAFAAAGAGDDRQVRAGKAAHVQRDGDGVFGAAEEAAQEGAAAPAFGALAQYVGQELVFGDVDRRAARGRDARVDEVAKALVVIAQHRDRYLEQFVGVAVIAQQPGDLAGGDIGVGHKAVGKEPHRPPRGDAAQDTACLVLDLRYIVDELAVFDAAVRVGRNKGKFVRRFAGAFDGPHTKLLGHSCCGA